ncbi:hypothetical protein SAMN04515674_103232 [Pseudarcicella hirudinis]|uniref:Uncharacterized protein n=1 Tax=Pseudarcicella hirudinis TaxID=1079859 RepID=A0A1I5QJA4_9BACT|nr:hypothetical protein [Pseudarcicella hirudinis]SFP46404.1 hypothetical protein SAMN04515674_103232 [Pseudarcicella hirudinis]
MELEPERLKEKWEELLNKIETLLEKRPSDLNAVLFLVGVQELGKGHQFFTKEQKQDLMHIAICKVLSYSGIYELEGLDQDGWPHWKMLQKLPYVNTADQERILKLHVIEYFEKEVFI